MVVLFLGETVVTCRTVEVLVMSITERYETAVKLQSWSSNINSDYYVSDRKSSQPVPRFLFICLFELKTMISSLVCVCLLLVQVQFRLHIFFSYWYPFHEIENQTEFVSKLCEPQMLNFPSK